LNRVVLIDNYNISFELQPHNGIQISTWDGEERMENQWEDPDLDEGVEKALLNLTYWLESE